MKPLEIFVFACALMLAIFLIPRLFWLLIDFVQMKLNERAIRKIQRDDDPPLAI